jgi:coenzyme F420 hydrogenase subunit beta
MENKGSKELLKEVVEQGLCTGCGACTSGCPYLTNFEGRSVLLDRCTITEGQCYKFCPRTYTDMNAINQKIFGKPYGADEIGVALDISLMRSTVPGVREKGQDGGTVTTLLALALEEGIIDAAISTKMNENKVPAGFVARNRQEILQCAGVSYAASFAMEAYNTMPQESKEKLGIVGVGCQIEALAKMKTSPPKNRVNIDHVKLSLGLFCGWALIPDKFHRYLRENYDPSQVVRFDIPHHPHYTFDVYTPSEKRSVVLDEIRPFINPACQYCWDMTAEFADISLGAAGSAFEGWNTVVPRTKIGADLLELAKSKGLVEAQPLPEQRLNHLKASALKRKKTAFRNIVSKSGSAKDLLYVGGLSDGITSQFLKD